MTTRRTVETARAPRPRARWFVLGTLVLAAACSRATPKADPAPAPEAAAPETPPPAPAPAPAPKVAHVRYDVPTAWREVAVPSPLRLFTYKTPRVEGDPEDPELVVSEAGGSVDANVQRWTHQVRSVVPPRIAKREVNGLHVTVVEAKGAYSAARPTTVGRPIGALPKQGYMLLGAVVEGDAGTHTFFKLVGPEKSVAAARPDFERLVGSLAKP